MESKTSPDSLNPLLKILKATLGSKWGSRITYYGLFPSLIILSLLLPPFSLGERVLYSDYIAISSQGGSVTDAYGAQLIIPPDALGKTLRVRMTPISSSRFLEGRGGSPAARAATAIPPYLSLASPFYQFDLRGEPPSQATLALPMLHEAEPLITLDLYAWTGDTWQWLPSHVEGHRVVAELTSIPQGVALMQTAPVAPAVSAIVPASTVPPAGGEALTEMNPQGLYVRDDGTIGGQIAPLRELHGSLPLLPTLGNEVEGIVRSDWVDNILISEELRQRHAAAILDLVVAEQLDGVDLDYRGIDPELRLEFTAFATDLARRLHGKGKQLIITVEAPRQIAPGQWDTGAYDWRALGQVADRIRIPALTDPQAYRPGGDMEALLQYAVGEVNRHKIQVVFSTASRDYGDGQVILRSYEEALALACRIAPQGSPQPLLVGDMMTLDLPSLRESQGIHWDEDSRAYWFTYDDEAGKNHIVWLEDATSLAPKLDLTTQFHLRGVALQSLAGGDDPRLWSVLAAFREAGIARAEQPQFAVVWTVEDAQGQKLVQHTTSPTDARFVWTAPQQPGDYTVVVAISNDGGRTLSGGDSVSFRVTTPTPEPTPVPTPTPAPPVFDAVVRATRLNLRTGPGTEYEIAGQCRQGEGLKITGKTADGDWLEVTLTSGQEGWVFAKLVDLNVPLDTIALATSIPPRPKVAKPAAQTASAAQSPASAVQAPPPRSLAGGVDYGIQVDALTDGDHVRLFGAVQELGFRWIKQQVEWFRFEPSKGQYNWGPLDRVVESANAFGLNILLSVVKAPKWARPANTDFSVHGPPANPQDFADFLGAMAARYKGRVRAYEVWNEQNLWYEWGHEPLDAARYVQLLATSYQAIKAADPDAIVVAGAPTPTGVNDGVIAIDDALYLDQMYAAGLKNYCDAVGAHPSGYNNPPDVDWRTFQDPTASFGAKGHRSWFFQGTLESYRAIMNKYGDSRKPIWVTEFGWASVEGLGVAPATGYEYAADNTEAEQAQFLVKAFQLAGQWGVGPMFVWNLNFGPVAGAANEKAAFGIVRPDWSRRPAFAALRDMPK